MVLIDSNLEASAFYSIIYNVYSNLADAGYIISYGGVDAELTSIVVYLKKFGAPDLTLKGILHSGVSGTEKIAYSTNTKEASELSTRILTPVTFTFANDAITAGNYVGLVCSAKVVGDGTNYVMVNHNASEAQGKKTTNILWTWLNTAGDIRFSAYGDVVGGRIIRRCKVRVGL